MVKPIASNGYVAIYDIQYGINDYVLWGYGEHPNPARLYRSKVYYTKSSGRAYFKQNGSRRYLDDFFQTELRRN